MYKERKELYEQLEKIRSSKLLVYVTGDRPGLETQIHPEVLDYFVDHLDKIKYSKKITLFLYTKGGSTSAAWSIANLIQQFCEEFEVIVPSKALSAGTLICLGAKTIIMTKQATLGPIDPSVNTPLNPEIPGDISHSKVPVSVEAINGYIDLAKNEFLLNRNKSELSKILISLSEKVHPLVLGEVVRARSQIQMLANKLLLRQINDKKKIEKIIKFLVSESGSHDYTINRREARDTLGLNIEKPNEDLYKIIKQIYDNIKKELCLTEKLDFNLILGVHPQKKFEFRRALIESVDLGSYIYITEGIATRTQSSGANGMIQYQIENQIIFDGWRYENI